MKTSLPKKTVILIVEGWSDEAALDKIFQAIYRTDKDVKFKVTVGDISSTPGVTVGNVEDKIYDFVREVMEDSKLRRSDIYQIVQIFDMDGAYIPDSAIRRGDNFSYSLSEIRCRNVEKIRGRNAHKREIMECLQKMTEIKTIPYEMYFMSRDLDNALYGVESLEKDEKMKFAYTFYEKFVEREKEFITFLRNEVSNGVPDDYMHSWEFIKTGLNSLGRHTNLHLYFSLHPGYELF